MFPPESFIGRRLGRLVKWVLGFMQDGMLFGVIDPLNGSFHVACLGVFRGPIKLLDGFLGVAASFGKNSGTYNQYRKGYDFSCC